VLLWLRIGAPYAIVVPFYRIRGKNQAENDPRDAFASRGVRWQASVRHSLGAAGSEMKADVNNDGRVNVLDLIGVRNQLGRECE